MPILEKKNLTFTDLKLYDATTDPSVSASGEFSGYVAAFGNKDRQGEIIVKGAFADTLNEFKSDGFIAIGHDASRLGVASIKDAYEDDYGLFVKGEFYDTQEAQDVRTVMRQRAERGKSVKFSIGYQVLSDTKAKDARYLNRIKLYEASYVTIPANPAAVLVNAKSFTPEQDLEDMFEEENETKNQIKSLLAGLSFAEHTEQVLAASEQYVERATALVNLRASSRKSGQAISKNNRARLQSVQESLLAEAEKIRALLALGQEAAEAADEKEEAQDATTPDQLEAAPPPAEGLSETNELGKSGEADDTKQLSPDSDDAHAALVKEMEQEYLKFLANMARQNGVEIPE